MRRHIVPGIVAVGLFAGVPLRRSLEAQASPTAGVDTAAPLVASLLTGFRAINQRLGTVRILGLLAGLDGSDTASYAVLALGSGEGSSFTDPHTSGELFGIFAVDKRLRSARLLGAFPSPRRGDYDAWLLEARGDSVVVCGRGAMYGDGAGRWAFPFEPEKYGPLLEDSVQLAGKDPGDGSAPPKTCPDQKR